MGLGRHAVAFVALVINLWLGGDLVQEWLGRYGRAAFEGSLILAYLTIVLGVRVRRERPPAD